MSRKRTITSFAKEYLAHRRSVGFDLTSAGKLLLQFARYADRSTNRKSLTAGLAIRWAELPKQTSNTYRAHRLNIVRGFAKYLAIFDPDTEIPPENVFGPAYRRIAPHIYTSAEVSALLAAARELSPRDGLLPHTYFTLFGLLACTGLRLREAVRLTQADVDWNRGLLTIRETKFKKSRLVPLHSTSTQALLAYAKLRDRFRPIPLTDTFFISVRGTGLGVSTVQAVFQKLRSQMSWLPRGGRPAPRIHDFRHSFACRRLLLWHEQGADVEHRILALSTYMGHVSINDTYWYLTGIPELMHWAGTRFEHFAGADTGDNL